MKGITRPVSDITGTIGPEPTESQTPEQVLGLGTCSRSRSCCVTESRLVRADLSVMTAPVTLLVLLYSGASKKKKKEWDYVDSGLNLVKYREHLLSVLPRK